MKSTNTLQITIDSTDIESLKAALAAGVTTPKLLADWIESSEYDEDDNVLILSPNTWKTSSDSDDYEIEADSSEEAAQQYVDGGDWDRESTCWVEVKAWRIGLDEDGDEVEIDEEFHTITLDPSEPDCLDGETHMWKSPFSIVGGIKENPGVWGSGGGVIIQECCMLCGCEKVTDTWAQNPNNGEQGLTSVQYEESKYVDEVNARHIRRAKDKLDTGSEQSDQFDFTWEDGDGILVGASDDELREFGVALRIDENAKPIAGTELSAE